MKKPDYVEIRATESPYGWHGLIQLKKGMTLWLCFGRKRKRGFAYEIEEIVDSQGKKKGAAIIRLKVL